MVITEETKTEIDLTNLVRGPFYINNEFVASSFRYNLHPFLLKVQATFLDTPYTYLNHIAYSFTNRMVNKFNFHSFNVIFSVVA